MTPRQEEVVGLAANGLTAKEIARRLGLSKRTVDEHFDAARARTGTVSRAELIAWALASAAVRLAAWPGPGGDVAEASGGGAPGGGASGALAPDSARLSRDEIAKIRGKTVTDESSCASIPVLTGTAGTGGGAGDAPPRRPPPAPSASCVPSVPSASCVPSVPSASCVPSASSASCVPGAPSRGRGGRPLLITPERAAAARDLLAAGHTIAETARRLRVSRASLYAHLDTIAVAGD